jgi:hypothetical protein
MDCPQLLYRDVPQRAPAQMMAGDSGTHSAACWRLCFFAFFTHFFFLSPLSFLHFRRAL